jgi:nitrite reductase (NADH) small subunit
MAFVRAGKVGELAVGHITELQVEGKAVAVANVGGKIYAISNTCLHRGGPLGEGTLEGQIVTCPWHGWQFDVTNGKAVENPATGVACYPVEVRGEDIFIDVG